MQNLKKYSICIFIILCLAGTVVYPAQAAESVLKAGRRCAEILIPSLYIFSILVSFSMQTGFLEMLAKPLQGFCRKVFRTDAEFVLILLFSQMGGYPVGVQLLHGMYQTQRISRKQEQDLLCVCIGCGFGFLTGIFGQMMLFKIWLLMSIPNLIAGLFFVRNQSVMPVPDVDRNICLSECFTRSVENAAAAMLKITSMIMAFAAFMGILTAIYDMPDILKGILEVSHTAEYMQSGGDRAVTAGLLSFGGICVHLQIAVICENHIHWGKFWLCRALAGCLTYLLCRFCLPVSMPVFLVQTNIAVTHKENSIPVCCLLVMSVFLLRKYYFSDKILTKIKK